MIQEIPWFAEDSIPYIDSIITKNTRVFEYGCGGSTVWFAKRCKEVISVEHNVLWKNETEVFANKNNIDNIKILLRDMNSDDYPAEIAKHGVFDLVIIDGRRRKRCIELSIGQIIDGGYLVLDNSDRQYYKCTSEKLLSGFKSRIFHNRRWETTIWKITKQEVQK